jgi:hypothetical protein
VERVLPSDAVKARLAAFALGLAADCDKPEKEVSEIMQANLPDARTLPFAAFLTHDGKWIAGFSGHKDEAAFLEVLSTAEKSPLLEATEAVRKKLSPLSDKASKAAAGGDWKTVLKAGRDAVDLLGRCEERVKLDTAVSAARAWAEEQLAAAVAKATPDVADFAGARSLLSAVKKQFTDEPEQADAEKGLKAITVLERWSKSETVLPTTREKTAADYAGTRWEALLLGKSPAPPEEEPGEK